MCGDTINNNLFLELSEKEEELFLLIVNTGFYINHYSKISSISNYTVRLLVNKGLIIKGRSHFIFTKYFNVYILSDYGKEYALRRYLLYPYIFRDRNIEHDYVLGRIYLSLSKKESKSWINEGTLIRRYPNTVVIDGMFTDAYDRAVGIEVITSNYSENDIFKKMDFIKKYCDKDIIVYTKNL